jgi:hypothetical protein
MFGYLKGFIAGFVSTLVFHQLGLLVLAPQAAYNMAPVPPFGIPSVISFSFWGGLWGIVLAILLMRTATTARYWLTAIVFGAIAPSVVYWFVVMPLKGQPVAGGFASQIIVGALLLNGLWGFGVGLILKIWNSVAPRSSVASS